MDQKAVNVLYSPQRPKQLSLSILILVAKAQSDTIVGVGPNLLDEAILLLSLPICRSEILQLHHGLSQNGTDFSIPNP
jgi:hypothetical protein